MDHWEAAAQDGTVWKYLIPTFQPVLYWTATNYADGSWSEGPSGFGYGDGDDATEVPPTTSIYMRHTFSIDDVSAFSRAVLAVDYDDGFVAYLNGTEVARGNAGEPGQILQWDEVLDADHEAVLYAGGIPDLVELDMTSALVPGENCLAVEVHNWNATSSDLTARPFLFLGATTSSSTFGTPPSWFMPPEYTLPVTFNVNMANQEVSPDGVFLAGGGNFGLPGDYPMSDDDGDGVWSIAVDVPFGFSGYYTFTNGACLDWSCKENLAGLPCGDPNQWNDRFLDPVTTPTAINTCFAECSTDGTCSAFGSSNLPLIQITTDEPIVDDPRVVGNMKVTNLPGGINTLADEPNEFDGQISIEIRGSSSQFFPKQSYALETQTPLGDNANVSLLGMPAENDWILHGPYSDKTLMRNAVIFELGDRLGRYMTRRRYCELFINGDYRGVYLLMENIKRDNNRVDIANLLPTDTLGDEVTGGYILKVDRLQGDFEAGWTSPYPTLGWGDQVIQLHKPEADSLHPLQLDYIQEHFTAFEHALAGDDFTDPELGYAPFIDVQSFIQLYFANEITKNVDAYRLSTYFYKEKDSDGGKLVMGPWWDYNLGFGNSDGCESFFTSGFESDSPCQVLHPFWWQRLREDESYRGLTRCMWDDYRADIWSEESVNALVDSLAALLEEPAQRDHARWPRLGQYVWPNVFIGQTYDQEVEFLRGWIHDRMAWLDANIEGECVEGCTDVSACNYMPGALYDDGSCEPCSCPGDVNGDQSVGVADILAALAEFGCVGGCTADVDGDNVVGVSDFLEILSLFGSVC